MCVWNIWRDVKLLPWLTELFFLSFSDQALCHYNEPVLSILPGFYSISFSIAGGVTVDFLVTPTKLWKSTGWKFGRKLLYLQCRSWAHSSRSWGTRHTVFSVVVSLHCQVTTKPLPEDFLLDTVIAICQYWWFVLTLFRVCSQLAPVHTENSFWLSFESGHHLAPVRFYWSVFARTMHSTTEFAKMFLSKWVIHAGFVKVAWTLRGRPFQVKSWHFETTSEFTLLN